MDYKASIKDYCSSMGLEVTGFSKCRIYSELTSCLQERQDNYARNEFEEKDITKRINPLLYMEDGKTVVSIAFPYFHGMECNSGGKAFFSKYTLGMDYHRALPEYLKKICDHIKSLGGKAEYFTDSNALPERYIAYQSGIGFMGKNNMLITKKYGSYVFLGEIITNLEIETDKPMEIGCGSCSICLDACPTDSLEKKNPNVCLSYITQKKVLCDECLKQLDGRLFGCDTCQDVCPFNSKIEKSPLECFKPYEFMCDVSLEKLILMGNNEFKEKYKKTSSGWRGKGILQRNALINLFISNPNAKSIINAEALNSPKLRDIYNRLLSIFKL
ncbi:MAG: tRNA epoxyqueuosine(34) reductase QueG [Clostridiaceae bacterium]